MLTTPQSPPESASSKSGMFVTPDGRNHLVTFALVSSLFLLWGFCNGMIDVMDKHFQDRLHLTLSQSAWVQFAHYLGYFLMALPASWLAVKLGYKGGIITGLLLVAVGGFWFIPATQISAFWAFLLGVCIIAAGLTFLETIANPYTTVLGPTHLAASRINLAQSCNGIGWIFGPIAGRAFFYSTNAAGENVSANTLWIPYAAVAVVVIILAGIFVFAPVPNIQPPEAISKDNDHATSRSIWKRPHYVGAIGTQFLYVAAQSGIFSFFINYLTWETPTLPSGLSHSWLNKFAAIGPSGAFRITDAGAAALASFAFMLFLLGRFIGASMLKKVSPSRMLAIYALCSAAVCVAICLKLGWLSTVALFLSYFFMSIMFPTIFALGIHGLGAKAKRASGYIVMAIIGGALIPKIMGAVGDRFGVSISFIVPAICFLAVAAYGFSWKSLVRVSESGLAS